MIYLMSPFVKLTHSSLTIDYFLIFLQLFNGFHVLPCAVTHVRFVNLTYRQEGEVYKVKLISFSSQPTPPHILQR